MVMSADIQLTAVHADLSLEARNDSLKAQHTH